MLYLKKLKDIFLYFFEKAGLLNFLSAGWIFFIFFIIFLLLLDQNVFQRRSRKFSLTEAWIWSGGWIVLALLFNIGVWIKLGSQAGIDFLTAYILEKSLSLDNLFVISMIFTFFNIPLKYQPRILSWGIWTAIILRFLLIIAGLQLLEYFNWLFYILGGILLYSCAHFFMTRNGPQDFTKNRMIAYLQQKFPVKEDPTKPNFFLYEDNRWYVTPLFLAMISIEFSDLVFALDSVPAVLTVTRDPFIVFTSNVFAILGLRALYFVLADSLHRFYYLQHGVALILVFVGFKMIGSDFFHLPNSLSLGVIMSIMIGAVLFSKRKLQREDFLVS